MDLTEAMAELMATEKALLKEDDPLGEDNLFAVSPL